MARVHGRLLAYIADEDESLVRILDLEGEGPPKELESVRMPGRPGRMLMLPGGRLAIPTTDKAEVAVYTPAAVGDGLELLCSLETPDEPVDLAETPDHKTLLVAADWGHALVAFDMESGERRFDVDLPRSPQALVASADGIHAYVAHASGRALSVVDLTTTPPSTRDIDLHGESTDPKSALVVMMPMPVPMRRRMDDAAQNLDDFVLIEDQRARLFRRPAPAPVRRRSACQGFALAELGGQEPRLLSPMVEVATGNLTAPSSGYGPGGDLSPATAELPVVAVIDEATGKARQDSVRALEPQVSSKKPPCLLPRAAVVAHGSLYVACMGIDAVVEYDATAPVPEAHERRRWRVGSGPTGLALHGSRAVVWSQFAGTASVLALSADREASDPIAVVSVARNPRTQEEEETARGRALFYTSSDSRISKDGRACASCHPNGRDDGLVWSTPGGPRQTPMLAGRLPDTAPYGWDGAGSDVSHHLDHTLERLEGEGFAPADRAALVRYISTLAGPTVHARATAETRDRGQAVFLSAGCASCHSPESAWTDGQRHEVSSRASADASAAFDTPSLRFVGGTAPYFHDGRYPTLRDLLTRSDGPMGAARGRPAEDIDALETFVRSL
jgi:mono/diheme cytochrome c family protein